MTFAAGETSKVVHVQVSGDTAVEGNETLTLTLASPSGATSPTAAIGTIANDDQHPDRASPTPRWSKAIPRGGADARLVQHLG